MPIPSTLRRRCVRCAIIVCCAVGVPGSYGLALGQDPADGPDEIDWYVPGADAAPTEQVSVESTIPGAPAPEVVAPPVVFPPASTGLPAPRRSAMPTLDGAEARYSMLGGQSLGIDMFEASATLKFADVKPFSFSPRAGVLFVDGPTRTDLPSRLYEGEVEFRWFDQIGKPFFYELAFIPGLFTDGDAMGSDALRLQARGVGYLAFSEQTQVALGATYLDRQDVPVLPVVGLIHSPREDVRWEVMFPRPRILKRVSDRIDGETWVFLSGELGGGAWSVQRASGRDDIANYRDYRLLGGVERQFTAGGSGLLEAGYVFGRELTYNSGWGDFDPDGTFMLRCGLSR